MSVTMANNQTTVDPEQITSEEEWNGPTSWKFWFVLASICLVGFLVPLDGTIVVIALPRIANEVQLAGEKYIWVSNSFWLAQTVMQPFFAQMANMIGRKGPMIFSMLVFGVGSAIAGSANSATALIAGRTLQGFGSAGMMLLMEVILCDIVPLRQRSQYISYALSASAAGAIIGPPLGGAIANKNWRWIFYMTVPLSGIIAIVMVFCLRLQHTRQNNWKQLTQIDWIGNLIFIGSITSILLSLVFGGIVYEWSSWHVLVPLVVGVFGWASFHLFEAKCCSNPVIPKHIFLNKTAAAGYAMIYVHSITTTWLAFQWPLYFQAVLGASPLKAGVNYLVFEAFLVPTAGVSGRLLTKFGFYPYQHLFGFSLLAISSGLNMLLSEGTNTALWAVFMALNAAGLGTVIPTILPVILNSLEESDVAVATGMYSFLRSFGYIWGSTIPSIMFNSFSDQLSVSISDQSVREKLSGGHAYEYASGSYIATMSQVTKREAIEVFVRSLKVGWGVLIAFPLIGLTLVLVEKRIPLRTSLNTNYGLEESKKEKAPKVAKE